jgi:hypothetical protein
MELKEKHLPIVDEVLTMMSSPTLIELEEVYKKFPAESKEDVDFVVSTIVEDVGAPRNGYGYRVEKQALGKALHLKQTGYYRDLITSRKSSADKEAAENEKLRLELATLRQQVADYPATKRRERFFFWAAVLASAIALVELVALLLPSC